jgi:hypothetical protein
MNDEHKEDQPGDFTIDDILNAPQRSNEDAEASNQIMATVKMALTMYGFARAQGDSNGATALTEALLSDTDALNGMLTHMCLSVLAKINLGYSADSGIDLPDMYGIMLDRLLHKLMRGCGPNKEAHLAYDFFKHYGEDDIDRVAEDIYKLNDLGPSNAAQVLMMMARIYGDTLRTAQTDVPLPAVELRLGYLRAFIGRARQMLRDSDWCTNCAKMAMHIHETLDDTTVPNIGVIVLGEDEDSNGDSGGSAGGSEVITREPERPQRSWRFWKRGTDPVQPTQQVHGGEAGCDRGATGPEHTSGGSTP